jgi:preprotein translocase subunit SecG
MLSFMKEQNLAQPEDQNADAASAAAGSSAAGTGEQGYFTVSNRGRDLRKSTIMLLILFVAGLLCLLFMIKKSTPKSASGATAVSEQTQIETTIARLVGIKSEMYSRMDEIVHKFYEFSDVLQVQVNELAKNPFQLEGYMTGTKPGPVKQETVVEVDSTTVRAEQIRQIAKNMKLYSIMQSDLGMCCMIDKEIRYAGNSINDFTISEIGNNYVKLQMEGVEVVLKLSQ